MPTPENWQKSSFSGGADGNNCVELANETRTIRLRESDDPSIELVTTPTSLTRLFQCIRSGALGSA
ncbi:DUF397 domain-containing protein [Streptomyces dioscori]|uniref:DUF397 domain-containing protein n=1 Tax=Streptomyces dioscori TaxID=2109333 RepID=A0A2P8Q6F3_9ACTN|nr:DUF397 domain-containing protein [Streptomyces dioscori]PSM41820.1 DUF397 domain-containing protein [Streptomyces dioscori]